ncbi:MAG: DUF6531 domain-containing protein [Chromatiales bacterium]|nr:hypothetical protein [Gammaproteobacteria bacterium]
MKREGYISLSRLLFVCGLSLAIASCGGGGGDTDGDPPETRQITGVNTSVLSDTDSSYRTGSVVHIDIQDASSGADIIDGTIRITSASTGYDSGEQPLSFGSIFFDWDTTGVAPAANFKAVILLVEKDGKTHKNESLKIKLVPNPPLINKLVSAVDLSTPAPGIPAAFSRTYLLDSTFQGPLGYGWTHNYRMRLVYKPTYRKSREPFKLGLMIPVHPEVQLFNADGTGSYFFSTGGGNYRSPKGDPRTLTRMDNGVFLLEGKHGTKYYFSANGKPFRIVDRNGNAIRLNYDGFDQLDSVTDASRQVMAFTYDDNNRTWKVTDPLGNRIFFAVDAKNRLTSVFSEKDSDQQPGLGSSIGVIPC